ncbi:ribonuclease P protein component [Vagococcus sp. PNs007]|uniref:Ribonuclease P protein component n=2 Tax=Vagococcus TaxID=2737 RepID=A0A430A9B0_9ENTE|nr:MULTISPECIES: ribonuclease P protein component [Vagococcus]MDF0479842.1 ribonuclease P protein component [Vagococcus proximus]RSU03677.1 ribonuclease P protein component [Vagococcus fessus]
MKKSYRIKKEKEFQMIMLKKKSFANKNFVVYASYNDQKHFRVGLSVGKKIGNAVNRNYVKRQIREGLFNLKGCIDKDVSMIVIARPNIVNLTTQEVKKNLEHVLKIAGIIS